MNQKNILRMLLFVFLAIAPLELLHAGASGTPLNSNIPITPTTPIGPIYPRKQEAPSESEKKVVKALIKKKCRTRKPPKNPKIQQKHRNP